MTSFSTAMMIFTAAMMFIWVPTAEAQNTCVDKLIPCYNFLNTTAKPSEDCCESIKEAVEKQLACLCSVYSTPGFLSGFNVSTQQALGLSRRCDVTADVSSCFRTPSPKGSLPPPGKGKDAGVGKKLAGFGIITTMILSLISTIFF